MCCAQVGMVYYKTFWRWKNASMELLRVGLATVYEVVAVAVVRSSSTRLLLYMYIPVMIIGNASPSSIQLLLFNEMFLQ